MNQWNNLIVFLGVTHLVQGPQGIIPSLVWVEPPKQRDDFRRAIIGDLPAKNIVIKSGQVIAEREVGSLWIGFSACDSGSVATLIEHGSEIADGIENDAIKHGWKPPSKSDLVTLMSGYRIILNNVGPWLIVDKGADLLFELTNVMMCSIERELRAGEHINHDR